MWFKIENQQVKLFIFAKPNAKRTALVKINEESLHIALHAKPHESEANKALITYLAKLFQLPKSRIILHRGENSRYKIMIVPLTIQVTEFINHPDRYL